MIMTIMVNEIKLKAFEEMWIVKGFWVIIFVFWQDKSEGLWKIDLEGKEIGGKITR